MNSKNESSFSFGDSKQIKKKVILSTLAFDQLKAMAQLQGEENSEFSAYAPVLNNEGELFIPKLYATTQQNTSVETISITDPEIISNIENDFPDDPEILSKVKCHLHTHPKGINNFSGQDDALAEGWFSGDEDFLIMIMITEEFKTSCRIEVYRPFRVRITDVKIELETSNTKEIEDWKEYLKSKRVKPKSVKYSKPKGNVAYSQHFSHGNNYFSGKSNNSYDYSTGYDYEYSKDPEYDKDLEEEMEYFQELKTELEYSYSVDLKCRGCGLEYNDYEIAVGQCSGQQCSQIIREEDFESLSAHEKSLVESIKKDYDDALTFLGEDANTGNEEGGKAFAGWY